MHYLSYSHDEDYFCFIEHIVLCTKGIERKSLHQGYFIILFDKRRAYFYYTGLDA